MNDIFCVKKTSLSVEAKILSLDIIYFPLLSADNNNFDHLSVDDKPPSPPSRVYHILMLGCIILNPVGGIESINAPTC